ncbi:Hypothetical predicted protein [Octopus vulgaris]|uniref:Uncharacterized protein n=1 Tax=Octopus vulgaris TaxID=6645 RepID=A0AA36AW80_OCTVU|nr:Hypothetical predicted protein [Octopus vulgaris]
MNTTENDSFSSYQHLCYQPDQMADHNQYQDNLNEESDQTTGDNNDMYSEDDSREITDEDDIGDEKESQNNDQLDEDFSSEDDYPKDEKAEICVCEVADDENGGENNILESKTHNEDENVSLDNITVKLKSGTAEFDKSVPNEDEGNYDTSMKYAIEGGKINTMSDTYPHNVNSDLDRYQDGESFVIYRMFYIPKFPRKREPEYEVENIPYTGVYELERPYSPRGLLERRTRSISASGRRIKLPRERHTHSILLPEHHLYKRQTRLTKPLKYRTASVPRYSSGDTPRPSPFTIRSPKNCVFVEGESRVKLAPYIQPPDLQEDGHVSGMSVTGTSFPGFAVDPISVPEAKSKYKALFRKWDPVFYNVDLPPFKQKITVSEMPDIKRQIFQ